MGLFDKFKKKENANWETAYKGNPNFYEGRDGKPFGVFALTEGTLTSFPQNPKAKYMVDSTEIEEWRLMLVSTTKDSVLGDTEYYTALDKLAKYVIDKNEDNILIQPLSLEEISSILK